MICDFSPVAFYVFDFPIHWYSLAYIFGIIFTLMIATHLRTTSLSTDSDSAYSASDSAYSEGLPTKEHFDDFLNYAVLGIVIGGRLGHVLCYDFEYYFAHPAEIIKVWKGGMSFFGGLLGAMTAIIAFCRINRVNFWKMSDLLAVGTPIGLGLGRIANFINGELIGKETDVPWAFVFRDGLLRHPSQLYEAFLEGILLFCVLVYCAYGKKLHIRTPGTLSGIFCAGYGIARFIGEFFREPDSLFGYELLYGTGLNFNQYLSIGIFFAGCSVIYKKFSKTTLEKHT